MEMEVICISSDDESDSQKENKTDKSQTKSAEISNGAFAHEETEILFNIEKVEEKNLKRKVMCTEKKITCNIEKRKKLDVDQGTSEVINKPDVCSLDVPEMCIVKSNYNVQSNKDHEVKSQLIVKEKKKISYILQDVFPLFISLCLQKCPKHDKSEMAIIIDKLKRRYENLDPIYVRSENFVTFLNGKRKAITNDSKKIYVHIQEVMNEMKKKIKKSSQTSQINDIYDAVPSTSYATNNIPINNVVESDNDNDNDNDNEDEDNEENANLKTRRKIKQILRAMNKCETVIKKLEDAEVDFSEENDSNYIKVERYKRKMIELYNKLCELTGENADAGRVYLRPKHLNVTRIVAVDQAITNFINCKITERNYLKKTGTLTDDLIFPDYRDILECVTRCNDKKNLGLSRKQREDMAEKAFKELGEHLQRSRRNDYWDTFSLYLENTEDPATKDKNLAKKLADNRAEGEKRLAAVFDKYTKKQAELGNQNNEGITSEEEEEDEEEREEDEEVEVEVEVESITCEDKDDDILSISSEENNEYEENADETVKENKLLMEKNKPNINVTNVNHAMNEAVSNKTAASTLPEKYLTRNNKTVEIKIGKESNTAVSNENKIIGEEIVNKPSSSNTIPRNIVTNVDTISEKIVNKPSSNNIIPRNIVTNVDTISEKIVNKPSSSNTIPRNIVTNVDTISEKIINKPSSSNTIPRNIVTNVNTISEKIVNKPSSSNIIPRNIVTNVDTISEKIVNKPNSSNIIPRNIVTNVDTISEKIINKPSSSNTIPRNIVTNVDTISEKIVNKPSSSNTIPRNIVTNVNTISEKIINKPSSSNTISRNIVTNMDIISEKIINKPSSSNTIPRNIVTNVDTISEKIVNKPSSSNTISKNVVKNVMDTKTQEDSLPAASTSNCTKDLAEAKVKDVSKVITDPATKKATEGVTATVTSTENAAEVITNVMDETTENTPNNEQLEEEKKPLLRVRSFAKPPTTWEDNQHKTNKTAQENAPKIANQIKEIVDLTNEETAKSTKCAVQLENKVIVKRQKVFIPSSSNIISVKNITNNYLKVNTRTGQIIAPVHDIRTGATIIRLPSVQTTNRQSQSQNTNVTNQVSLKGKTIVKLIPAKSIIISKSATVQSVSKQTDVSSSTQSK